MKQRRSIRLVAGVMALGLVAAACGGDDDDTPADSGSETTDEATTETAEDTADCPTEDTGRMSEDTADEPTEDTGDMSEDTADEPTEDSADTSEDAAGVDLSGVCPSPLVIQTDWFPEAEHGALYEMVGADYVIDAELMTVTGPLMAAGADTGIEIEVRTGGPAIGFNSPRVNAYTDDSIHIVYS